MKRLPASMNFKPVFSSGARAQTSAQIGLPQQFERLSALSRDLAEIPMSILYRYATNHSVGTSQRDDAKTYSIPVDLASIAIAALLIRARSKNLRLPCAQQAASMIGPGLRSASYSRLNLA